jgi:hypothetical protein
MKMLLPYLSWRKSLGAAQAEAQCIRWKTISCQYTTRIFPIVPGDFTTPRLWFKLTLLDAVLLGLAGLLLLLHDALGALVVVVLERGALLGLHALCVIVSKWFPSRFVWQ